MIKKNLIFLLFTNISFSLPSFAVQNGSSCIACHVNPTGGGQRNDYGSNVVALEELPMKRWLDKGNEDWDGFISDHLQIGGDFRVQGIQYDDSDTTQNTAIFPMQADIYTNLILHKNASIFTKLGVLSSNTISISYWILLENLPYDSWLKMGRSLPNFGLRIDDHTSFYRGGNINRTKQAFEIEGMIFNPFLNSPILVELGFPITSNIIGTGSIGTPLIDNSENIGNFTTHFNYTKSLRKVNYFTGLSYLHEKDINLIEFNGGVSVGKLAWLFARTLSDNWIDSYKSLAVYHQISYTLFQGFYLIGKYDFFDPKLSLLDGAISRFTLGIEIYPLHILEINVQVRLNKIELDNFSQRSPEFLIQSHIYF